MKSYFSIINQINLKIYNKSTMKFNSHIITLMIWIKDIDTIMNKNFFKMVKYLNNYQKLILGVIISKKEK